MVHMIAIKIYERHVSRGDLKLTSWWRAIEHFNICLYRGARTTVRSGSRGRDGFSPGPAVHHVRSSKVGSQGKCNTAFLLYAYATSRSGHIGKTRDAWEKWKSTAGGKDKKVKHTPCFIAQVDVSVNKKGHGNATWTCSWWWKSFSCVRGSLLECPLKERVSENTKKWKARSNQQIREHKSTSM